MAATILQIAQLAGVSRGTVDRALHGREGVNPEVAKRIAEIARELNYEPNFAARTLANSRNKTTISVIINSGGNPFFLRVIDGVTRAASEMRRYNIRVAFTELTAFNVSEQIKAIEYAVRKGVKGIIITPINDVAVAAALESAIESGIGVVTMNTDISRLPRICFVGCNYRKSGNVACELMGKLVSGETEVGIVSGSKNISGHNDRIKGFCEVAKAEYKHLKVTDTLYCDDNDEKAYQMTKQLVSKGVKAIYFCAGGIDGGMRAVIESGKKIMVVTVDDTENIKEYIKNGLVSATVCQQPFEQGYRSVKLMSEWLLEQKLPPHRHCYTQNEVKLKYNLN